MSNEEQSGNNAKPVLPAVLICDCSSREHQIIIEHDNEDNLTYCHIHLVKHGFWRRLKAGLKYIFGYKCRYGQWDEFIGIEKEKQYYDVAVRRLSSYCG